MYVFYMSWRLWEGPLYVLYVSWRLWEAHLYVIHVSWRLWEAHLYVFYVSWRLWEAHLYLFYVSGGVQRAQALTNLRRRVGPLKKDLTRVWGGEGGEGAEQLDLSRDHMSSSGII